MRIALVHISKGVDGTPISPVVDHLGLENIAGELISRGYSPKLFDSFFWNFNDQCLEEECLAYEPNIIGFSTNYANIFPTLSMINRLKKHLPQTFIVFGGYYATFHTRSLLRNHTSIDAIVLGEGENTFISIVNALKRNSNWKNIKGVAYFNKLKCKGNTIPIPPDLNALARADRSNLHHMKKFSRLSRKIAIEFSRGCVHECRFCSVASLQKMASQAHRRRTRLPLDIVHEMEQIVINYDLRDFWFMDADFLGPKKDRWKIQELARNIIKKNLSITMEADARTNYVDEETIKILHEAGMQKMFLGVESFDQPTLDFFAKGTSVAENQRAIDILEKNDIRPIIGTILFHQNSSIEQLKREHRILKQIGYHKTQMLFRLKAYTGTIFFSESDSEGRGVSANEDYGWKFKDEKVSLFWELFDETRLSIMEIVFHDLTKMLQSACIDESQFSKNADDTFRTFGEFVDIIIELFESKTMPSTADINNYRESIINKIKYFRNTMVKKFESFK